jgi:hypothetical protein
MSTLLTRETKAEALDSIALNGDEAANFTKLSAKTLERLAQSGEPVGRIKIGRRVVFLKGMLESWLASKASIVTSKTSTH